MTDKPERKKGLKAGSGSTARPTRTSSGDGGEFVALTRLPALDGA